MEVRGWYLDVWPSGALDPRGGKGGGLESSGVTFRFASYYGDHMVLQKKPAGAVVWGYGEAGANVTVSLSKDSKVIMKKMAQVEEHSGTWKVVLAPMDHGGPYSVMAEQHSREEPKNLTLRDIYFGDVWLCSGQSNMEMTVSQIINASKELSEAPLYPYVRVFMASLIQSEVELQDLAKIDLEWSIPTAENLGHGNFSYFSAVCWLFGRHLYETLRYPIGLVESSWGGSCIEAWSSGRVLQECGLTGEASRFLLPTLLSGPKVSSVLWNAMIHPLLNMSLTGVIWYQGEANALVNTDLYNCTFPALIADWRRTFHAGSEGQTQPLFPFGFVQLSTFRRQDQDDSFPRIRWHQTADYGYAPNKRMPNTFMAVAVDLCDEHSPYSSIHPRDKQNVAYRLHLGARAVAYGEKGLVFQGPYPTKVVVDGARGLINVTYGQELLLLLMHDRIFEVCCSDRPQLSAQEPCQWVPAPMVSASSHAVTLSSPGCRAAVTRLRYAWAEWPCEYRQCPLYNKHLLPAPPFVIDSALRTG
ncbi:sialate O-acetylesterase isoform X1 [Chrysemys picta bellii]|uniref:sialate O-acetylesterase isoform X1 n=1 Tax=Chrysemys picta bellii TaxID=8478 RepID=UPI0032B20C1D